MGGFLSTSKLSVGSSGAKKSTGSKETEAKKGKGSKETEAKKGKGSKKTEAKKGKGSKKTEAKKGKGTSKYEDEEYTNYGIGMVPGAYSLKGTKTRTSEYESEEEYETDEEYEDEEYNTTGARQQNYPPADFSNAAMPVNFSLLLLALLFIMIVVARR